MIASSCATSTPAAPTTTPPPPPRAQAPAYCGDLRAFRTHLLADPVDAAARAALERWTPGPDAQISEDDRPHLHTAARAYIRACGLWEAVALTRELVAFPTVSAEAPAPDHPAFSAMASRLEDFGRASGLGFSVYGAHDAWEVTLGEGVPLLGFVMHADVVPVQPVKGSTTTPEFSDARVHPLDWATPPFQAVVKGDRLHGRGTEDDKGPIAAVLVVLRTLRQMGLVPRVQVLAIMGTGEEGDWSGMRRYVAAKRPPLYAVSVDASFPVVIAEAGFVSWTVGIRRTPADRVASSVGPKVVEASAGQFLTQVPGEASMELVPATGQTQAALVAQLEPLVAAAVEARGKPFAAQVTRVRDSDRVRVVARGASVHSSTADEGANPVWILGDVVAELRPAPSAAGKVLELVGNKLSGDHWGEKLGVAYTHPMMGKVLVTPTLIKSTDELVSLGVNMRRPAGRTKEDFEASLDRALAEAKGSLDIRFEELGRYVGEAAIADLEGPLVPTLLDIWQRATGQAARATTIRGGTYARLFPGAVSFGPSFPGNPYKGHGPDEYIELEALAKTTEMILEATLRLADGARAP
jgi:predicted dipeptidase